VGVAGLGMEVAVLVYQPLERVEELEAPPGVGRTADALSGNIDVHGRGVGEHRLVERVGVRTAAGAASATSSRASTERGVWKKRSVDQSSGNSVKAGWG
jgi:hypothetical protein